MASVMCMPDLGSALRRAAGRFLAQDASGGPCGRRRNSVRVASRRGFGLAVRYLRQVQASARPAAITGPARKIAGCALWFRILPALLVVCGCAAGGGDFSVGYTAPFIPVSFSLESDGHVSISLGESITTPIGTFSVGASIGTPISSGSTRILIIQTVNGSTVEHVYDIGETGTMNVCLNGQFFESVSKDSITVQALGATSQVGIVGDRQACVAAKIPVPRHSQPAPLREPAQPLREPAPVFSADSLGTSVYSGSGYYARIVSVTSHGFEMLLTYDATGQDDLRDPTTSCVQVSGADGSYTFAPLDNTYTVDVPGHYAGAMTFPITVPGSYTFTYSCQSDYSTVPIGTASLPVIGISAYTGTSAGSPSYEATIISSTNSDGHTTMYFAATGPPDLRDPSTSCLQPGTNPVGSPDLDIIRSSGTLAHLITGTLSFATTAPATFQYSCEDDYTTVRIP